MTIASEALPDTHAPFDSIWFRLGAALNSNALRTFSLGLNSAFQNVVLFAKTQHFAIPGALFHLLRLAIATKPLLLMAQITYSQTLLSKVRLPHTSVTQPIALPVSRLLRRRRRRRRRIRRRTNERTNEQTNKRKRTTNRCSSLS